MSEKIKKGGVNMDWGTWLLSIILFLVGLVIYGYFDDKKKGTIKDIVCKEYENQLILKNRVPSNRNVLKVEEQLSHTFNYEPEKIVYTGASVGGVHTGGFHKEGGYYSVHGSRTGTYMIMYDNGNRYDSNRKLSVIDTIKLDSILLINEAKSNRFISQFLRNDTLVLKYNAKKVNSYWTGGDLCKEDCRKIVSWLSNELN